MSSSNMKSWLFIGVGVVAAIGAAIFGIRWFGQQQTQKVISSQVDEWGELWLRARACLVGDDTTFKSAGYAYLMYEATHTGASSRVRSCEPLIRKLKRPGSEATGVDKVEASWENVTEATKQLTRGFVGMIDQSTYGPMAPRRQLLADALDGMDAAYARLRDDGNMSAATMPGKLDSPAPLPPGIEPKIPGADGQAQSLLAPYATATGDVLLLEDIDAAARTRLTMRGLETSKVLRSSPSDELAADDAPWTVWVDIDDVTGVQALRMNDLDDSGAHIGDGTAVYTAPDAKHSPSLRFALGHDTSRAVLFDIMETTDPEGYDERSTGLWMARSSDRGATWSVPVLLTATPRFQRGDTVQQRFDVTWLEPDGSVRWLPIRADRLATMARPITLFQSDMPGALSLCSHGDTAWWLHDRSQLYLVSGDAAPRVIEQPQGDMPDDVADDVLGTLELEQCTGDTPDARALLSTNAKLGVQAYECDARACTASLLVPVASHSSQALGLGGVKNGVIGVTQTNDLVLVYRDDKTPTVYLGEPEFDVKSLLEWDGVTYLLMSGKTDEGLRLVPLPGAGS